MRDFFGRHEILWILPLALLFGTFSVLGLRGFDQVSRYEFLETEFVPLKSLNYAPRKSNQIYCKSRHVIDFALLYKDPGKRKHSDMVVYDAVYRNWAMVDKTTTCGIASESFVENALSEGYVWQDWLYEEGN